MVLRARLVLFSLLVLTVGFRAVEVSGAEVIPSGTILNVRTSESISADYSQPGMQVEAIVDDPITINGQVIIPRGATATLEVIRVERSSTMKGRDRITLKVHSLHVGEQTYPVSTSYVELKGSSEGKKASRKMVGGAGLGAVVGGIFGGGTGAAIGAASGAATGGMVAGSGKTHLHVPAETVIQFRFNAAMRM